MFEIHCFKSFHLQPYLNSHILISFMHPFSKNCEGRHLLFNYSPLPFMHDLKLRKITVQPCPWQTAVYCHICHRNYGYTTVETPLSPAAAQMPGQKNQAPLAVGHKLTTGTTPPAEKQKRDHGRMKPSQCPLCCEHPSWTWPQSQHHLNNKTSVAMRSHVPGFKASHMLLIHLD